MNQNPHGNPLTNTIVGPAPPDSAEARALCDALWGEIQRRYDFTAPNPMQPDAFAGPRGGFWLAHAGARAVGCVGLIPLSRTVAEVDAMYVAPDARGTGAAHRLMDALEAHARRAGFAALRLRTGGPQPEAVRFYEKRSFRRIPPFGRWADDPTAWCYEKTLDA